MNRTWIRTIAILEIIGGVVGILFCFYGLIASGFALNVVVVMPISFAIFVLSLVGGIYLWRQREFGRKVSIIVQFIQLPKLISSPLTFMFSFGIDTFPNLTLVNDLSIIGLQFRILADGQLFFMGSGKPLMIGVSIPAIILITRLWGKKFEEREIPSRGDSQLPPAPNEYFDLERNPESD